MTKIAIIGGGAAGMYASVFLAEKGHEVHVFEKNEKLGKKLFITGKGRCNVTNDCDEETFFSSVITNSKFLYSSYYGCTSQNVMDFFTSIGVKLKTERGNRVFPASDHSSDIIRALEHKMRETKVQIHLRTEVTDILSEEDCIKYVVTAKGKEAFDKVIVATGGYSYQATGSTGDGYRFAENTGHSVTKIRPALVPLEVKEDYITKLQGLALKNVQLTVKDQKKKLYEEFGELLFTHFGVSGPLVLTASSKIGKQLEKKGSLLAEIDLKPAVSKEQLDARILREFETVKNKQLKNAIGGLFPAKFEPVMIEISRISPEKKVNEITKEERRRFIDLIKAFPFTIIGMRDFNEAIITQGGVKTKEINPSTMESKKVKNLYFIGEVLDLDAVTGGFNLQIAWATAYAAVSAICMEE